MTKKQQASQETQPAYVLATPLSSGHGRYLGRTGRNYGILRAGQLAWVHRDDFDGSWIPVDLASVDSELLPERPADASTADSVSSADGSTADAGGE